jgi:hypothetical protein
MPTRPGFRRPTPDRELNARFNTLSREFRLRWRERHERAIDDLLLALLARRPDIGDNDRQVMDDFLTLIDEAFAAALGRICADDSLLAEGEDL